MNEIGSKTPESTKGGLGLATLSTLVVFSAWSILGPLGPFLQSDLKISDQQLALLVAVPILVGSVLRIPLGLLSGRFGGRRMMAIVLLFTPLPLLGLAFAHASYSVMLALALVLGVAGSLGSAGTTFLHDWY